MPGAHDQGVGRGWQLEQGPGRHGWSPFDRELPGYAVTSARSTGTSAIAAFTTSVAGCAYANFVTPRPQGSHSA